MPVDWFSNLNKNGSDWPLIDEKPLRNEKDIRLRVTVEVS